MQHASSCHAISSQHGSLMRIAARPPTRLQTGPGRRSKTGVPSAHAGSVERDLLCGWAWFSGRASYCGSTLPGSPRWCRKTEPGALPTPGAGGALRVRIWNRGISRTGDSLQFLSGSGHGPLAGPEFVSAYHHQIHYNPGQIVLWKFWTICPKIQKKDKKDEKRPRCTGTLCEYSPHSETM